ncbi:MAG: hypothetical protein FWD26_05120 [Treponema sp.]|nr:hypothetical protein [Treponema sp.]
MKDNEKIEFCFKIHAGISEDDYITHFSSPIIYQKLDKDYEVEEEKEIGKIDLIYLHANRAIDNKLDIVDLCDREYQELYDYVCCIYENGYISEELNDCPPSNNVLILDQITLEKSFQGKGLGKIISKKMINFFGYDCGGIIIKPFPLQFSSALNEKDRTNLNYLSEKFSCDVETGRKKILNYWKKLSPHCEVIKINDCEKIIFIPR